MLYYLTILSHRLWFSDFDLMTVKNWIVLQNSRTILLWSTDLNKGFVSLLPFRYSFTIFHLQIVIFYLLHLRSQKMCSGNQQTKRRYRCGVPRKRHLGKHRDKQWRRQCRHMESWLSPWRCHHRMTLSMKVWQQFWSKCRTRQKLWYDVSTLSFYFTMPSSAFGIMMDWIQV